MGMMEDAGNAMAFLREQFPDVVVSYGQPLEGPAPGDLTVEVGVACCGVRRDGTIRDTRTGPATVSTDRAGDLAYRPEVHVQLVAGDPFPLEWLVLALGFVEAEAKDTCEQVAARVPAAWARAMTAATAGTGAAAATP